MHFILSRWSRVTTIRRGDAAACEILANRWHLSLIIFCAKWHLITTVWRRFSAYFWQFCRCARASDNFFLRKYLLTKKSVKIHRRRMNFPWTLRKFRCTNFVGDMLNSCCFAFRMQLTMNAEVRFNRMQLAPHKDVVKCDQSEVCKLNYCDVFVTWIWLNPNPSSIHLNQIGLWT